MIEIRWQEGDLFLCSDQQGSKPKKDEQTANIGEGCYNDAGRCRRIGTKFLGSQWHHRAGDAAKATADGDRQEHYKTQHQSQRAFHHRGEEEHCDPTGDAGQGSI